MMMLHHVSIMIDTHHASDAMEITIKLILSSREPSSVPASSPEVLPKPYDTRDTLREAQNALKDEKVILDKLGRAREIIELIIGLGAAVAEVP